MAPRKTNNNAPKKPVIARKRVQEKKPLKTPTLIKLKLSTRKSDPDSSTPKVLERHPTPQKKLELANEVALAQLNKNAEITLDNVTTTKPEKKITQPKKNKKITPPSKPRGRPKTQKTISEFFNETAEADSAVVTKQTPKKIIKKTPAPKKRKIEISCPQIKSADSTVCKKGRVRKTQKETTSRVSRNLRSKNRVEGGVEVRAAAVSSRTNSGASSTPSWTRDISSSSTTTCVTVGDFVRIDNRLPLLQLPDIAAGASASERESAAGALPLAPAPSDSSSASSSTSTSSSSSPSRSTSALPLSPAADHLNLSTTSSEHNGEAEGSEAEMDLLRQMIEGQKKVESAFQGWMGRFTKPDSRDSVDGVARAFHVLNLERDILLPCRRVRQILRGEDEEEEDGDVKPDEPVSPAAAAAASEQDGDHGPFTSNGDADGDNEGSDYDDRVSCKDNSHAHLEHSPDDEDAISLFAESTFTDWSSRRDEYVPRPLALSAPRPPHARVYHPTPIAATARPPPAPAPAPPPPRPAPASDSPLLLDSLYQQLHGTKSAVFKGACFYSVIDVCLAPKCRYPHIEIAVEEIERRVAALDEVAFIEEYMLVRRYTKLRRLYGLIFVREAERRDLTRVVLEMAIDISSMASPDSAEDVVQREAALEAALTLLSLEAGRVRACADLLRLAVPHAAGRSTLIDLLINALANTANFSRFKRAFIELAALVVADGVRLEPGPLAKILERVCILPHEEELRRAMLAVMPANDAAAMAPYLRPPMPPLDAGPTDPRTDLDNATTAGPSSAPPQMLKPIITRTVDFVRLRGNQSMRQFRSQWQPSRGRARARGHRPGYQHSSAPPPAPPPIFMRRPPPTFSYPN